MQRKYAAVLTILIAILTACGGGNDGTTASTSAEPSGEAGSILISGSSTVEPISALVAESFRSTNPGVGITVEGPGTSDGFVRFCAAETDISGASREIREEEAAACAENGIEYVELHIATDGLSVITSPENAEVTCLNYGDLYSLLGPESEGFASWSDANDLAAEVGGSGDFPEAPLVVTAPGEESGTYDTFVELVLADLAEERGADEATRADYQASANDNVIVDNISSNPSSLGWVGFAFFTENADTLKAIEVDGGDGCIAPTTDTIASFDYPLSRPLYIYVSTTKLAENPALGDFVDFYLSSDGIGAVSEAGYVDLPEDEFAATVAAWEGAK